MNMTDKGEAESTGLEDGLDASGREKRGILLFSGLMNMDSSINHK